MMMMMMMIAHYVHDSCAPWSSPKLLIWSRNDAIQDGAKLRIVNKYKQSTWAGLDSFRDDQPQLATGSTFCDTVPVPWSCISTKIYQVCYYQGIQSSCNPIAQKNCKAKRHAKHCQTISSVCSDKVKDWLSFRQEKLGASWRLHSLQPNFNPPSEIQCPMMSKDKAQSRA